MRGGQGPKVRDNSSGSRWGKREGRSRRVRGAHHDQEYLAYEAWQYAQYPAQVYDNPGMLLLEAISSTLMPQMAPGSTPSQRATALYAARVAPGWLAHHMHHINSGSSQSSLCTESSVLIRGKCMRMKTLILDAASIVNGNGEHSMVEIGWPVLQALLPLAYKPPQRLSSRLIGPNQFCLERNADLSQVSHGKRSGPGVVVHLLEPIPGSKTLQQHLEQVHGNLAVHRRVDMVSMLTIIQEIALALYEMPNYVVHGRVRPASCYVVHHTLPQLKVVLADMGGTMLCMQGYDPGQAARKLDSCYASARRLMSYGYPTWQDDLHALCMTAVSCILGPKHLGQYLQEPSTAIAFWLQANAWVKKEDAHSWRTLGCSAGLQVLLAPEPSNRTQLASFRLEQLCAQPGGILAVDLLEACCRGIFPTQDGTVDFHLYELLDKLESLQRFADWMQQGHVHAGGSSGLPLVLSAQLWSDNSQTEASALVFYQQLQLHRLVTQGGRRPHTVLPFLALPPPMCRMSSRVVPQFKQSTTSNPLCAAPALTAQLPAPLPFFSLPPIKVKPLDIEQPHEQPDAKKPAAPASSVPTQPIPKAVEQPMPVSPNCNYPPAQLPRSPLFILTTPPCRKTPRSAPTSHHQSAASALSPIPSVCGLDDDDDDDHISKRDQDKELRAADASKDDIAAGKRPSRSQHHAHRRRKSKGIVGNKPCVRRMRR